MHRCALYEKHNADRSRHGTAKGSGNAESRACSASLAGESDTESGNGTDHELLRIPGLAVPTSATGVAKLLPDHERISPTTTRMVALPTRDPCGSLLTAGSAAAAGAVSMKAMWFYCRSENVEPGPPTLEPRQSGCGDPSAW